MLFEVHKELNKIDVFGFELIQINAQSEEVFWAYLRNSGYDRVSYFSSFYYLYPISLSDKNKLEIYYMLVGDWMFQFELNTHSGVYRAINSPISKKGDYSDMRFAYKFFIGALSKLNGGGKFVNRIYRMNAKDTPAYLSIENIRSVSVYKEFIFRCSDLIELQGKKYKSRRHVINRFKATYSNVEFRQYTAEDKIATYAVYEKWCKGYMERFPKAKIMSLGLVEETLSHFEYSDKYRIFVALIDEKIVGFIVITPLCKNTSCVLIEYTDLDIQGLGEYLWYEGLRHTQDLGEFENDGTGGDDKDTLFAYKNSHCPIMLYEANEVSLNSKSQKINKNVLL